MLDVTIGGVFSVNLEKKIEDEVQECIDCAIDRLNDLLPPGGTLPKSRETILLGPDSRLDSMGFVNLVVALEDEYSERFGRQVSLADDMNAGDGVRTVDDLHRLLIRMAEMSK